MMLGCCLNCNYELLLARHLGRLCSRLALTTVLLRALFAFRMDFLTKLMRRLAFGLNAEALRDFLQMDKPLRFHLGLELIPFCRIGFTCCFELLNDLLGRLAFRLNAEISSRFIQMLELACFVMPVLTFSVIALAMMRPTPVSAFLLMLRFQLLRRRSCRAHRLLCVGRYCG